jgi:uncharacterized protein
MLYDNCMPETHTSPSEMMTLEQEDLALREVGTLILKIHTSCQLRCYPGEDSNGVETTDCYMYKKDTEHLARPKVMSLDTAAAAAEQLGKDARKHHSPRKKVTAHGGEATLAKPEHLEQIFQIFADAMPEYTVLETSIETNGIKLGKDPAYLEVFRRFGTRVGISLDGDEEGNGARVYHNGRTSFDDTMAGIEAVSEPRYRHLFGGILAVLNPDAPNMHTYNFLKEILAPDGQRLSKTTVGNRPPVLEFLLPVQNYVDSPYRSEEHRQSKPYAGWLNPILQQWMLHDRELFTLRTPQLIIDKMAGREVNHDAFGGDGLGQMVINTNGTYALTDTMLYAGDGITTLPISVYRHGIDQASALAYQKLKKLGALGTPTICANDCPKEIGALCGGGNIPSRFTGDGEHPFDNPSVLCGDLGQIVATVRGLAATIGSDRRRDAMVDGLLPNVLYQS